MDSKVYLSPGLIMALHISDGLFPVPSGIADIPQSDAACCPPRPPASGSPTVRQKITLRFCICWPNEGKSLGKVSSELGRKAKPLAGWFPQPSGSSGWGLGPTVMYQGLLAELGPLT